MNRTRVTRLRQAAQAILKSDGNYIEFSCHAVYDFAGYKVCQNYALTMGRFGEPLSVDDILSVARYNRVLWRNRGKSKVYRRAQEFRAMLVLMYAAMVEAGDVEKAL